MPRYILKQQQEQQQPTKAVNQCKINQTIAVKGGDEQNEANYNNKYMNKRLVGWQQHQKQLLLKQQQEQSQNVTINKQQNEVVVTATIPNNHSTETSSVAPPYYMNSQENRNGKCFLTFTL